MSQNLVKVGQRFLNELHKEQTQSSFQLLESIMEQLELKEDPSSTEIKLIDEIYQFLEKYRTLQEAMKTYVHKSNSSEPESDKLHQLLEKRKQKFWNS